MSADDMPETRSPVEVTTKFATTVDDLPGAWTFVMACLDSVGPDPDIRIMPRWGSSGGSDDEPWPRHFAVIVSGSPEHVPGGEP